MGKEQDLLHAAKNGNVAQIERILGQRNRRSGIHSFISRNVSPNFQDDMGYTALHYSSLNGHKTAVGLLLKYDASANIPDNSGNSPLHLAAFNGHAEVTRVLINQGPSRANVNEQNGTEDTALHSAAQYDHNQVVAVLLENHGDPFLRNCRAESALDLAAQYGRIEPVKLLLSYHPNLLQSFVKTHTPLHLAARNGHVSVVSYLLSCGMDVNTKCDSGTALHDASLFGKVDVVNLLLQCGVDLQVKNKDDLTVMDLLMTHPSSRTQEISKTIYNYSQSRRDSAMSITPMGDSLTRSNTEICRRPLQVYDTVQTGARRESEASMKRCDTYNPVPVPRSKKEMRAISYDSVPEPRRAGAQAERAPYDSHHNGTSLVQETRDSTALPDGYFFVQGVDRELQATSKAPILTQQNIQDGYSVLRPPANPVSKDPLPLADMLSQENIAYFLVGPHGQPFQSQEQVQSRIQGDGENPPYNQGAQPDGGIYDFVGKPVQPSQLQNHGQLKGDTRGRTQGASTKGPPPGQGPQAEIGFYDFVGNSTDKSQGQGLGNSEEPTEHGFYDFVGPAQMSEKNVKSVKRSSVKQTSQGSVSPQSTYDLVQIPVQPTRPERQVQKPNSAMTLPETNYDTISFPPKSATSDLSNSENLGTSQPWGDEIFGEGEIYEPVAQLEQTRHGSDNHCPLDIPDYEKVAIHTIRKQHSEKRSSNADEENPFAFLPGYEPMGPPEPSPAAADYDFVCLPSKDNLKDGYVALSPPKESETQLQGSPSQLPSSGIQQRRTGSVVSQGMPTSMYVVAPPPRSVASEDTPTYEIAPPPRSAASYDTPTYEIAPPPRSAVSHNTPSYEVAPPPRRAENTDTQTYEVGPAAQNAQILQSASLYEIAPPPRSAPSASQDQHSQGGLPVYEVAPTPRQRTKLPPRSLDLSHRESSKRPVPPSPQTSTNSDLPPLPPRPQQPSHGQPLFQKEPDAPKVPPRRMNEYSQVTIGTAKPPPTSATKQLISPSGHPVRLGAYEEVRPEGPALSARGDAIDWSKIQMHRETNDGGDYCALSTTAIGTMGPPPILPPRWSTETCSSTSSVPSERPLSPDFPPPSPQSAEQEIHRVLSEHKSRIPSIETIPENPNYAVVNKRRKPKDSFESISSDEVSIHDKPPPISPRVDSLYDEEFELNLQLDSNPRVSNEQQDPFSFPPSAAATKSFPENVQQTNFAALHERFSPHSSRENLAEEGTNEEKEEKEGDEDSQGGALIYENVLFTKREPPRIKQQTPLGADDEMAKRGKVTNDNESYRLSSLSSESPLDESAEWKKIEEFLSAIGEIEVSEALGDQIADAGKAQTVGEWLHVLQLSEYESTLISNGFDDLNFMNGSILEDQDLLEVGIIDPAHRKIILEAVKSLPVPPWLRSPGVSAPTNLTEWLEFIRLPEYFQIFNHNGYVTMERIKMLWELELTAVLEINTLGHRKRMLASLKEPLLTGSGATEPAGSEGNVDLEAKLAELRVYCPDEAKQDKPVLQPSGDATDMMGMAEKMMMGESMGVTASSRDKKPKKGKWRHDPAVLLKGSVNYTISYLGSHLVKTITGVESTVAACQKMRASTAKLQKVPSVQLSVSAGGVKFIDARSQILVSFHDVKNISYITQDPEEKQVFAYIAKDSKTEKRYCHVFKAPSNDLSDEITMTIGQAFELAYQQYMHVQSKLEANAQST